jgi:hypothetical protein
MQRISILTLPTLDQQELDRETLRWLLRERNGILCWRKGIETLPSDTGLWSPGPLQRGLL